jgi:hypothetical protein
MAVRPLVTSTSDALLMYRSLRSALSSLLVASRSNSAFAFGKHAPGQKIIDGGGSASKVRRARPPSVSR